MPESDNLQRVQQIFQAFGSGDLETILATLSEDVVWVMPGPSVIPYAGTFHGREEVAGFFQALGGSVEMERFEIQAMVAQGERVVVLGSEYGRVRASGRTFENPWAMVFTFEAGQVVHWQTYEDTAVMAEAFGA